MVANSPDPSVGTCGGTITANPGATSFSFSGGNLPAANASCSLTLYVVMNAPNELTNTIPIGPATSINGASNPDAASGNLVQLV